MTLSALQQLDALQSSYVEAVNEAVADDSCTNVRRLVAAYDAEAARLLGEVFPMDTDSARPVTPNGGLRRIVSRLHRAA